MDKGGGGSWKMGNSCMLYVRHLLSLYKKLLNLELNLAEDHTETFICTKAFVYFALSALFDPYQANVKLI